MLLKTFLKRLEFQPIEIRHDHYEKKDILTFEKHDGFFPYIEFQSEPKDKVQNVYFDVLNWTPMTEKYVSNDSFQRALGFTRIYQLSSENTLSVIDEINECLQVFYLIFKSKSAQQDISE